jgi:large subunit ribosomal protein L17
MRHKKAWKHLSRNSSHRRALLRNLVTSLLKHGQIVTTDAKAKAVRPLTEKMITLAKRGDLHARRQALAYIQEKAIAHKLFDELKDRHLDRQGGYVRIIKKGIRKGDGAPISIVQLVSVDVEQKPAKKKTKVSKKADQVPAVAVQEPVAEKKQEQKASDTPEVVAVSEEKAVSAPDGDVQSEAGDTIEAKDQAVEDLQEKTGSDFQMAEGEVKEENAGEIEVGSSEKV